jgi:hypothetical protein
MLRYRYVAFILILVLVFFAIGAYFYMQLQMPSEKIHAGFWIAEPAFMPPEYWANLTEQIASSIKGTSPANIWVVGRIVFSPPGTCILSFPSNQTYPHMFFEAEDANEDCLKAFDDNEIKVCLEVEPGFADVNQLINVVLERYGHHPCILGVAVDLEWRWNSPQTRETVPVTDDEANQWLSSIKSHNPNYKLFLIHWLTNVMPHTAREDIVFIDDAQDFNSLDSLVEDSKLWGRNFSRTDVGCIFGYRKDLDWLSKLENPPKDIGLALIQNIPNCRFVFWSQETILEIFPQS